VRFPTRVPAWRTYRWSSWPPWAAALAIALVACLAYKHRIAPSVTRDDPAELQVLTWAAGIPHGTSYPFYVWLVHAFLFLPFGPSVAQRVTMFSVFCAGGSLVVLMRLAGRVATPKGPARWLAAAVAAGLLAYAHTFWGVAIIAGMYTLHVLFAGFVLLALVAWEQSGKIDWLWAAAVALGMSMGNHVMTLALLPGVVVFVLLVWWRDRAKLSFASVLAAGGTSVACVAVFNCLFFYSLWQRHLPFDHWASIAAAPSFFAVPVEKADSFWYAWWYEATCRQFRFELFGATPELVDSQVRALPHRLVGELFPVGAALAAIGWLVTWRRSWRLNVMLTMTLVAHAILVVTYYQLHKSSVYLLVPTFIAAVYVSVALGGLAWAWSTIAQGWRTVGRFHLEIGAAALVLLIPILYYLNERTRAPYAARMAKERDPLVQEWIVPTLGPRPDESTDRDNYDHVSAVVDRIPAHSIVFVNWPQHYALEYVARIERRRGDLTIYEAYPYGSGRREIPSELMQLIENPNRSRPVFFLDLLPPLHEGWLGRPVASGLMEILVPTSALQ
jgi:hypothetical protein